MGVDSGGGKTNAAAHISVRDRSDHSSPKQKLVGVDRYLRAPRPNEAERRRTRYLDNSRGLTAILCPRNFARPAQGLLVLPWHALRKPRLSHIPL